MISEELKRCGLDALQEDWDNIARKGYCTMNPMLGRWLTECAGEDSGPSSAQPVLGITKALDKLSPNASADFKAHSAADDAQMTRLAYVLTLTRTKKWRDKPMS